MFLYYLRFWLTYRFPETPVLGTRYPGPLLFDFVVTWIVCSLSVSSADLTLPCSMRVTTLDVSVWVYELPELAYS